MSEIEIPKRIESHPKHPNHETYTSRTGRREYLRGKQPFPILGETPDGKYHVIYDGITGRVDEEQLRGQEIEARLRGERLYRQNQLSQIKEEKPANIVAFRGNPWVVKQKPTTPPDTIA